MIKIESKPGRDLDQICEEHFAALELQILSKVNSIGLSLRQRTYLSDKNTIKSIIKAKPTELLKVHRDYVSYCTAPGKGKIKNIKKGLSSVFNYKNFSSKSNATYSAYDLTNKLGVNTCPYCNRNYITTVENTVERIIRPDIDHFYAKSDYPLLGLSFYNLIPSCLVCNRTLKGKKKVQTCINPYHDGFNQILKFNFFAKDVASAKGLGSSFKISFLDDKLSPSKAKSCFKNVELFKLDKIYEMSHGSDIADIIRKYEMSGGRYLEVLKSTFPELGTLDDLYRIAFGNYHKEEQHDKRPLAKLTRDTVDQLKFYIPVTTDLKVK